MVRPRVNRRGQQGLALLVMVIVLILGSAFFLVKQLNSTALRLNSDAKSNNVLAQAKDALIGYAATNSNRPGALPCPDLNAPGSANEGTAAGTCSSLAQQVGRLPWKTLNLPDLRDASGERLWYALSDNFRDASGKVVNSDTPGTLELNGNPAPGSPYTATSLANSVVAIVFAPGAAVSGQTRDPSNTANLTLVSNYLDGANGDSANDDVFVSALASDGVTSATTCGSQPTPCAFNDILLAVTHADLFSVVDGIITTKLKTDIAPIVASYFNVWGAYPFPASFVDPTTATSAWSGVAGNIGGLLPLSDTTSRFTWVTSPKPTIAISWSGSVGQISTFTPPSCTNTTATQLSCFIRYRNGTPIVTISARVAAIGSGFTMFYNSSTGNPEKLTLDEFDYDNNFLTGTGLTSTASHTVTSGSLNSDGSLNLSYSAKLAYQGGSYLTRTLTLKSVSRMSFFSSPTADYPFLTDQLTSSSYSQSAWFANNEWYRLLQYAVPARYAPGGAAGACSNDCLTVNGLSSPNNDKRAILVFASRAIASQTRPSANMTDYFEAQNSSPADRIFESNVRSNTFNDKVLVLAP